MADQPVPIVFTIRGLQDLQKADVALRQMGGSNGSVARATRSTGKLGSSVQNASFQITDFIVQVEGGVSATRALGQQLPQLLGAFGAFGAAAGVVVSLLPAVIRAFGATADEVVELSKALDDLNSSSDKYNDLLGSKIYTANLEQANRALREQTKEMRELSLLQKAMGLFESGLFMRRQDQHAVVIENLREQFGITEDVAEQLNVLNRQMSIGFISAEQYAKGVMSIALNTDQANKAFFEFAKSLEAFNKGPAEDFEEFIAQYSGLPTISQQVASGMRDIEGTPRALVGPEFTGPGTEGLSANERRVGADLLKGVEEFQKLDGALVKAIETTTVWDDVLADMSSNWDSVVTGIAQGTQTIDDAFKSMAQSVIASLARMAAQWAASEIAGAVLGAFSAPGTEGLAKGGVIQNGVKKYAKGGIVSRPTLFPMANGAGLMGEAGPEAIMPLGRNSRGELGVKGGMNVTINNMAPGVQAVPRETDSGLTVDIVMQSMTNAVRQGGNMFSDAVEQSYALNRGNGVY